MTALRNFKSATRHQVGPCSPNLFEVMVQILCHASKGAAVLGCYEGRGGMLFVKSAFACPYCDVFSSHWNLALKVLVLSVIDGKEIKLICKLRINHFHFRCVIIAEGKKCFSKIFSRPQNPSNFSHKWVPLSWFMQRQSCRLVFGGTRLDSRPRHPLPRQDFRGFSPSLQANSGKVPLSGNIGFLPKSFQFIVRECTYISTLYGVDTDSILKIFFFLFAPTFGA
jgi:hypothetical protein